MLKNNHPTAILPGQTIGIIGGGQLGRMMAIAGRYMGYKIVVLDPTPNCPTAQVADEQIIAPYDDLAAIKKLTTMSDVVTYEFENVDLEAATLIEEEGKLPQGAYALEVTQNRQKEKEQIEKSGLPVPSFKIVHTGEEVEKVLQDFPLPAVIKTCRGGYDGKGQFKIHSEKDFQGAYTFVEEQKYCIIEQWVSFDQEISVIFTRRKEGQIKFFPIAENHHENQILAQTIVPTNIPESVQEKAIKAAATLAEAIDIVGTFALEMFVQGNEIYINEMAPRPHNSGHYTIEACNVSQFTQHIRAICGLPLMDVELLKPALMKNVLGKHLETTLTSLQTEANAFVHLYGKEDAKPERKMGHITYLADERSVLEALL